jgi:hypothetical protein
MVMLGKRYIALVPRLSFVEADDTGYTQPERDEDGKPIVVGYNVHHNAKLYEEPGRARREANAFMRIRELDAYGRVLVADLDEMPMLDETEDEQHAREERLMLRYTAAVELRRSTPIDKADQDYHARVQRTYEIKDRAATEIRRLLEAFRPPHYVIETRRNCAPTPKPERTWFGNEHDELASNPRTWIACLKDSRPDGSDAHVYVMAVTETGALAKLLAHIMDGGGFFPMT